jgi:hypothetical protein
MKTTVCLSAALAVIAAPVVQADGIPEPPIVVYGKVTDNTTGARLISGTLTWTWQPVGGGNPVVVATTLTNINDQFSFVLFVPCETEITGQALSPNTLRLGQPNTSYSRQTVDWNGQPLQFGDALLEQFTFTPTNRGLVERIDLGLGAFPEDSDGDGLPDWWEMLHFGSLAQGRDDDFDGDGLSERGEYISGNDPKDPASALRFVTVIEEPTGHFTVEWSSVPGRFYSILRAPSLSTDPDDHEVIWSGTASDQTDTTSYRDEPPPGNWFYRVRVAE